MRKMKKRDEKSWIKVETLFLRASKKFFLNNAMNCCRRSGKPPCNSIDSLTRNTHLIRARFFLNFLRKLSRINMDRLTITENKAKQRKNLVRCQNTFKKNKTYIKVKHIASFLLTLSSLQQQKPPPHTAGDLNPIRPAMAASLGPATFWTQADALLRKNLTFQVSSLPPPTFVF
ncbi:hypothetical protein Dsin_006413 [Dipteronia sinensis]|uniref:Uncharacterized protein n=1 Tax=Dipteronia sinensis TaxID=43782 RepID=A0AAE0EFL4_9ROSI|nr:hypothetical protein Dsin_006413 [Dipteronia sinensis]